MKKFTATTRLGLILERVKIGIVKLRVPTCGS
jgi:hypothetical protein